VERADFLIVGGGVAGLSAAARLARHGRAIVLEAEDAIGFHSSGRSATFSHFGIGNRIVRALTAQSRAFFLEPDEPALAKRHPALFIATRDMAEPLVALKAAMAPFAPGLRDCDEAQMLELFPPLRTGPGAIVAGVLDPDGLRLDSDALLQRLARDIRGLGSRLRTASRVGAIAREGNAWSVATANGDRFAAPVLINAAGAWADEIAAAAGIAPIGLRPLRRTIIVVDPPPGADVSRWPFVKTAVDDFYILPEAGKLMASPVDEVESGPCDAQPDEYDVALGASKTERYTTLPVKRIAHRWAGLRTFTPDRTPAIGFDPDHPGFFWLAGQGGFGLQTAPAVAAAAEALVSGAAWPEGLAHAGLAASDLAMDRLRRT
jgi:D-arginine dehydrogenase